MKKVALTKIQVAEIQINEAVYLFFHRRSSIAVETLAGATIDTLRSLAKHHGYGVGLIHDSDLIKPEKKSEWIRYLHKSINFFKHADKDHDKILEYRPESCRFMLLEACYLYRHIASDRCLKYRQSPYGLLFEYWFSLKYPQFIKDQKNYQNFQNASNIPDLDPNDFEVFQMTLDGFGWVTQTGPL